MTRHTLDASAVRTLLGEAGVPFADWSVATSREAAVEAAVHLTGPFALKTAAADVIHKSDAGCVLLGIEGADAVGAAYEQIAANAASAGSATPGHVLIERMTTGVAELVIGLKRDETFGPVLLTGLGGIWVETLRDVSLRLCPVTDEEAEGMLRELRGFGVLDGGRGGPCADILALATALAAVSRLGVERSDILELDINPILAMESGCVAIDGRIVMEDT